LLSLLNVDLYSTKHILIALYIFQGLCPGNRLRVLNSYDSGCFSPSPASSPVPSLAASTATLDSSICSAEIYENGSVISAVSSSNSNSGGASSGLGSESVSRVSRRSWHASPTKVCFSSSYRMTRPFTAPLDFLMESRQSRGNAS